jgi:hypothetical protein
MTDTVGPVDCTIDSVEIVGFVGHTRSAAS